LYYVAFCLLLMASFCHGQTPSATVAGLITDSTGAEVADATATLTNLNTGTVLTAVTNSSGLYHISGLLPGVYRVNITKQGFKSIVKDDIELHVQDEVSLNFTLQIGSVSESVTVESGEPLLQTTTADISTVVNQESVEQLPLNGRDPSSLVLLTTGTMNLIQNNSGGVTGGGWRQSTTAMPDESGASSGGGRQGSTYYLLDGSPNMDTFMALAAPFPNSDATQEFRVITENFDAQYGFAPSAVVTIQTKSGTNTLHGGAFEFIRNSDLNAANYFSHQVDPLKRNQFGGFVGGPIIKEKLFFFTNYQATRESTTATSNTTYTPTQAMLKGDFSAVPGTLGGPFQTIGGIPNQVDPSTFSAASVAIATTALPLGKDAATGMTTYEGAPQKTSYNEGTGRIDYTINDKQRVFLRSFVQYYNAQGASQAGNLLATNDGTPAEYYNTALGHTWVINTTTVNNLNMFYTQLDQSDTAQALDISGKPVCWSRYIAVNELSGHCDLEGLTVTNGFNSPWGYFMDERRSTWGLSDSLMKTLKKHTLSVGIDLRRQFSKEDCEYPVAPIIGFSGQYTGSGLADFLLGYANSFEQGGGEIADILGWEFGAFVQEQYRVKPNLTLTAGLRWDPYLPLSSALGRGGAFIPGQQSTMYPNAPLGVNFPGDKGVSASLMPSSYGYYQPRIGLNWQPSFAPRTAIRAGFGLFTGPMIYSAYNHAANMAPFSPTFTFQGGTAPDSYIPLQTPYAASQGPGANPFPPFASITTKPASNTAFQTPMQLSAVFGRNFRNNMTESWSVSIEQQLMQDLALHVAYVGSESYHLATVVDQNAGVYANSGARPYASIGLGQILTDESAGNSSYHSLQASIDKRMSHGLQIHSNFTWSKVLDESAEGNISEGGSYPGVTNPFDLKANKGISDLNMPLISTTAFTYTSPTLRAHNSIVRNVLGAWGLSSIYSLESGRPFGVVAGGAGNNSEAQQFHDRADIVPGVSPAVHKGSRAQWLQQYVNPAAFTDNAPGTFGNAGRNLFRGPRLNSADTAITKNWKVQERYGLQFRWEMFNTFNHTSFATPTNAGITNDDISLSTSNFGQITSVGEIPPRVMQGALKLTF
jgi:hypothetical protein